MYLFYLLTMLLLLAKSRCMNIGVDVSYQFEPEYMSRMANLIIQNIDLDVKMVKRNGVRTRKFYVDQIRTVTVEGVEIKICNSIITTPQGETHPTPWEGGWGPQTPDQK